MEKRNDLVRGAVIMGFGLFALLLCKEDGSIVRNEITGIACLLLISGLVVVVRGAARKLIARKEKPSGETDPGPLTDAVTKKLDEQRRFLDSGLITREEYEENCAAICGAHKGERQ